MLIFLRIFEIPKIRILCILGGPISLEGTNYKHLIYSHVIH